MAVMHAVGGQIVQSEIVHLNLFDEAIEIDVVEQGTRPPRYSWIKREGRDC